MTRRVPFPFLPVPTADWREGLTITARLVVGVYVRCWMRGDDVLSVSLTEIQGETGIARHTAMRCRTELVERGVLVPVHRGGGKAGRGRRDTFRLALDSVQPLPRTPPVDLVQPAHSNETPFGAGGAPQYGPLGPDGHGCTIPPGSGAKDPTDAVLECTDSSEETRAEGATDADAPSGAPRPAPRASVRAW